MSTPRLIYGAIRERHEDGSHTDEPGSAPEWFVEVDGEIYHLAPAQSCPAVPAEWIAIDARYQSILEVNPSGECLGVHFVIDEHWRFCTPFTAFHSYRDMQQSIAASQKT